jgi:hypothetical protein
MLSGGFWGGGTSARQWKRKSDGPSLAAEDDDRVCEPTEGPVFGRFGPTLGFSRSRPGLPGRRNPLLYPTASAPSRSVTAPLSCPVPSTLRAPDPAFALWTPPPTAGIGRPTSDLAGRRWIWPESPGAWPNRPPVGGGSEVGWRLVRDDGQMWPVACGRLSQSKKNSTGGGIKNLGGDVAAGEARKIR